MLIKCAAVLACGGAVFGGLSPLFAFPGPEAAAGDIPLPAAIAIGALQGGLLFLVLSAIGLACAQRLGWEGVPLLKRALRKEPVARQVRVVLLSLFPVGFGLGILLVVLHTLQSARLPEALAEGFHPPPAQALVAGLGAGYGEELIFRLFLLSLLAVLLRPIGGAALHAAVILSALAHAAGHLPATLMLTGKSLEAVDPFLWLYILTLNGAVSIPLGYIYIQKGWEAAASAHFGADLVWHVLYPAIG